jgi:hypothetical protein
MTVGRRATNVEVRTVVAEPSIRLVDYANQPDATAASSNPIIGNDSVRGIMLRGEA